MKLRVALAAAVAIFAFAGTPTSAQAGGLHELCPLHMMQRLMHHHHAPAPKAAPAKKAAPKVVKAAKKPLK